MRNRELSQFGPVKIKAHTPSITAILKMSTPPNKMRKQKNSKKEKQERQESAVILPLCRNNFTSTLNAIKEELWASPSLLFNVENRIYFLGSPIFNQCISYSLWTKRESPIQIKPDRVGESSNLITQSKHKQLGSSPGVGYCTK